MAYDLLIKTGRIKPYQARSSEIQQLLKVADRDLAAAARNLAEDTDWAYTMAYNAILQSSRALILKDGYRPRGGEQHATVVEYIHERLGPTFDKEVGLFDQMRRKRHKVIYEISGLVSKQEAEQAVAFAKDFVDKLKLEITRQHTLGI
jgi:uncharacterized protein (UPF0332 family)